MPATTTTKAPGRADALLRALRDLGLGERLLTTPAALATFGSDALTAFHQRPVAVVLAETREEVVEVVRLCHREGVPFVARGSGTSLSGGSLPVEGGIVIALNRLDRVLRIDPDARTAVVEPGVINLDVSRAAARHGLAYAPDPSSQSVCTIGGNLAFNSGGAHCLKHGMTSNHVLGIEAVLPDGEVVRLGGDSTEPVGPDWTGMFCGSEGLFGIAVEVTLRLVPLAEATHTALAVFDTLAAAGGAVADVVRDGLLPVAMEIMDALAIEAAEASVKPGYPEGAALLIVELEGEREVVDADAARAGRPAARVGGDGPLDDRGRGRARADLEGAQERLLGGRLARPRLPRPGRRGPPHPARRGARGDRAHERGDRDPRGQRLPRRRREPPSAHPLRRRGSRARSSAAEALAADILRLCIALGGSITGEHGVGVEKRAYLPLMFNEDDMALMRRLRDAVDPGGLANPGKVLAPAHEPGPA